jgi:hypothetical protein
MQPFIKASINIILLTSAVVYQSTYAGPTGMSEEQMQKMMKQAQAAQACMEKVDQSKLEALEVQSKKMQSELKTLCAAGKRDEAMNKAMKYSLEMKDNPALKAIGQCGEMMQGMIPKSYLPNDASNDKNTHVCDNLD